jgi:hypothetical protein
MGRLPLLALTALLATALTAGAARADEREDDRDGATKTWRVTVANLTPAGSQPLSPPLLVVHSKEADVWSMGEIASHGVAALAEDANNAVLESALPQLDGVKSASRAPAGRFRRDRRRRTRSRREAATRA